MEMQKSNLNTPLANNHISVDCVVVGFDGDRLKVLLIKRVGDDEGLAFHDMKLPGSLIYKDEDLDGAAMRVLSELTGLKNVDLIQFKAFGSKNRTSNPKDVVTMVYNFGSAEEYAVYLALESLDMFRIDIEEGWVDPEEEGLEDYEDYEDDEDLEEFDESTEWQSD